jgi:hypothetical protein
VLHPNQNFNKLNINPSRKRTPQTLKNLQNIKLSILIKYFSTLERAYVEAISNTSTYAMGCNAIHKVDS